MIQHQRWDIHTTGGSTAPDDNGKSNADTESGKDGTQQYIVSQHQITEESVEKFQ